ncbi:FAD-dependent monooxygenase [Streptomyces sp. ACA25]|uniref:FAD-dependent monooxygenase n=1 Tax=Streptomyces sp. ACA25 TaxID=3022596 RepID=UPI002307E0D6|nr:FAD-dependent monooxygenase [Streptomyces sp. ACA25]MDB1087683.1 FAD-dependent monooxygenase [Streptomyces sp. ACA25]
MHAVVIAGAGPTGLALACGLLAAGVPARLVDRATGPAGTSRALGLQPRGAEVLDRTGALGDLPQRSRPIGQVRAHVNGTLMARLDVGRGTKLVRKPGLLVSQAEIEAGLRHRLEKLGGQVEWGRELTGADQDEKGVTVRLADSPPLRADWLVGCDGAHSRVRKAAGIGFPGVPVVERFLLADVRVTLPIPRDAVSVWLRGDQLLAAFPLPGTDVWRLMAPAAQQADNGPAATSDVLDTLTGLLREHARVPFRTAEPLWTSTFRIHRRLATRYRQGRVLLAGDSAHIHSPVGGQGMNTGLGDAENLAWKLALVAAGRADHALLDTYEAERRPLAQDVLETTSAMTRMIVGESPLARVFRDRVGVPLMNRPVVQRAIWNQASQLGISYRGGPLAGRSLPGRRPRPGDRVPDVLCTRNGEPTRLHAELGPHWALLLPPASPAVPPAVPTPLPGGGDRWAETVHRKLGDTVTVLATAGERGHPAMLVRPDAHLAWRGSTPAALDRWLADLLDHGHTR